MSKSKDLDQYFTKRPLAKELYDFTVAFLCEHQVEFDCWLEPAAGDGAFFNLLPPFQRMGIDIEKRLDEIIENDFLSIDIAEFHGLRYVAIGNPPFGKNSNLAIKFFNRCAEMCEAVAFIAPQTFKKSSVQNRLHLCFHLGYERDLPDNSFEIDGQDKHVPCCFQIWIRGTENRPKIEVYHKHDDLEFLSPDRLDKATVLFQRVGAGAGTFKDPPSNTEDPGYSWKSNYYIKCSQEAAHVLRSINHWPTKYHTAGNPSISKSDLIKSYSEAKAALTGNL
jgi:hypothetical protein